MNQEAVENIGSGIRRIRDLCRDYGIEEPEFTVSEHWVTTTFKRPTAQVGTQSRPSRDQAGTKSALSRHQVEILGKCAEDQPLTILMKIAGRSDRTKFRNQVLLPLLAQRFLELTLPDKPRSGNQKYRLTAKGKALLVEITGASG